MGLRTTLDVAEVFARPDAARLRTTLGVLEVFAQPDAARMRTTLDVLEVFAQNIVPVHAMRGALRDAVINHLFRSSSLAKPERSWLALYTVPPSESSDGVEVTGGDYARLEIVTSDVNWNGPTAGNGQMSNAVAFTFTTPTANWGTLTAWGLVDAETGGNVLVYSTFSVGISVANGSNPRFPIGALIITFA